MHGHSVEHSTVGRHLPLRSSPLAQCGLNPWEPPSPPRSMASSSSPLRAMEKDDNTSAYRLTPHRNRQPRYKSTVSRRSRPGSLASSPSSASSNLGPSTFSPSTSTSLANHLASGSVWHDIFVLQCSQRARSDRQERINRRRNGLEGDALRIGLETEEEMAVLRRSWNWDRKVWERDRRAMEGLPLVEELELACSSCQEGGRREGKQRG